MSRRAFHSGRLAPFVLAVLTACVLASPAPAADQWALSHAHHWMIDPQGRVVIMHGENLVVKSSPWVAIDRGFSAADAAFLADNGLNSVRLGFMWAALEPKPGAFDDAVLAQIRAEIRLLHAHGIGVLLDSHQDMFNPKYNQGDGFPDWAINDSGLPNPALGFPNNYLANPAEQQSWNNFWNNVPAPGDTIGVQTRYIQMWGHVAAYLAHQPGIIGYDLLNEPMPGTRAASCAAAGGCGDFEVGQLSAFYRGVTHAIRMVDPRRLIFFEPVPTFAFGTTGTSVDDGSDPQTVFNFHNYCLEAQAIGSAQGNTSCSTLDEQVFQNADAAATRTGDPEFMSEFGGNTNDPELALDLSDADQHMVGWMEWEFCACNEAAGSPTPGVAILVNDERKPPSGANVNHTLLDALVRPYPQAIAGTPTSWSFDTSTRSFTFAYSTSPAGRPLSPGARTEVFVPRLVYTGGYATSVTGGCVLSRPDAQLLEIATQHGANRVTVSVTPRSPDPLAVLSNRTQHSCGRLQRRR